MIKFYPHFLAAIFTITFIVLGISPVDRDVWIAEVIPVIIIFIALVLSYKKFQFSYTAYSLMTLWLIWHTIGGHYTFANVPFDFVTNLFNFERNHFDRVGHFMIGFYAYPMAEFLVRKNLANRSLSMIVGLLFIMSIACAYEIIEWIYAVTDGGNAGIEFLGSQGDIWDAQKDMLADTLGAIVSLVLFLFVHKKHTH